MRWVFTFCLCFLALPALAQEEDKGYLATFLEENLSGAGRDIRITGFAGALSSEATIDSLTIADADGIWITLNGIVLDWSRSSLLSGNVVVTELSAKEIIVARAPRSQTSALPDPEAQGFSLPELPVSVEIGRIAAERIMLEAPLLGSAVEGNLEASLSLAGGQGAAKIALLRTNVGPEGRITLDAGYSNADGKLVVSLLAAEGQGGIAATLLGVPGTPAAELAVEGSGPLNDFAADISLKTDTVPRLAGTVTLAGADLGGTHFGAMLSGDLAPLFLPDYAAFFGDSITMKVSGTKEASGALDLPSFDLRTRSLALAGAVRLAADGLPEKLSLRGKLASPDGKPVLLPIGGAGETRVQGADIDLTFAADTGNDWRGSFLLTGLDRADFYADQLALNGSGTIDGTSGTNAVKAALDFRASGLEPGDPALAAALGQAFGGSLNARWVEGSGALSLSEVRLDGEDFSATANAEIEGLSTGLNTKGKLTVAAADFSRFSQLAGRPLAGSGTVSLAGTGSRLSGAFDVITSFAGKGLAVGIAQIDHLLEGQSQVNASVRRDETGTVLRSFEVLAKSLTAKGSGKLATDGSDVKAEVALADLGDIDPRYRGAATVKATFSGTPALGKLAIAGSTSAIKLGNPQLDRVLAGQSALEASITLRGGEVQIDNLSVINPQAKILASGSLNGGAGSLRLSARLNDLSLLVPEFPGPLTVDGTAVQDAAGYTIDLQGSGPGQVRAKVSGRVDTGFGAADLKISGTAQAALANVFIQPRSISGPLSFDLRLAGPLALSSLSGRASLSGGRLSAPFYKVAFERIEALVDLSAGTARTSVSAALTTGGRLRIDGPVGLSKPYAADLSVQLDRLVLVDPELYRSLASGTVTVKGPITGGASIAGRIALGDTEIRVPSSGLGTAGGLADLKHANEPADVRATRGRAGVLADAKAGTGGGSARPFGLDITISAPSRVFVRGRGIDAELGGGLRIGGTSANVIPSGGLRLIRGRLDILGKRLVLREATLGLQGNFIPDVQITASNQSDGITSFVSVSGPATDPVVTFSSVPELPQEEVLSHLLFGRGLDTISPLQAAQLAGAVASLAGRGGEGLVGKLRKNFGLDDLDVATAEDGSASLKAGKYLTDNVYTEVEVDQSGTSRINLNLDLRPGVTVKGRVGADGETGIGIFLERDY